MVDDSALSRRVLCEFLASWGVDAVEADGARQARELLARAGAAAPFDYLLIDVEMPECDGWTLVQEIRSQSAFDAVRCVLMPSVGGGATPSVVGTCGWTATSPSR